MNELEFLKLSANTVRLLAADGVQKAKSGHPGMPMGCADFAFTLWYKYMRHNPKNPQWLGRDRFILSAGHGSMLIYSLLHLFEYGLPMDELKQFRQWGSLTPGHPELGHTAGVEITTGPLGSGFASAVGMAIANKNFAARTGLAGTGLVDSRMFIISGDGCMMEGVTSEAASLAGHLKLDNLIVFYDDNSITIEGKTDLAFSEDVGKRFEAYNWRVLHCDNANDIEKCDKVLAEAVKSDGRPTLIVGKTQIGFGSPNKQGKSSSHGEPLGEEELMATHKAFGFSEETFQVPAEVRSQITAKIKEFEAAAAAWDGKFQEFLKANPDKAGLVSQMISRNVPENLLEELLKIAPVSKPVASRASSGDILQKVSELVPSLLGGAADLAPSTKSNIKNEPGFSAADRAGKNLHFGVRELAMSMMGNGMAAYGVNIPYTSTFFVFSDYMKPGMRLAAIQKLHQIYILTHDSFYVGEDGPTHEPIEQIAMLRTIPGMTVFRPADANEVAHCWAAAMKAEGPVAMLLTRQDLDPIAPELAKNIDVTRGAYVLKDDAEFDMIMIATGSEVSLAMKTAELLGEKFKIKVRVVSMPSMELFLKQDIQYQEEVLPSWCNFRVSLEAASTFGWHRIVGQTGLAIGIDHFGASAPYKVLAEQFGFTPDAVIAKIKEFYGQGGCGGGCEGCGGSCH